MSGAPTTRGQRLAAHATAFVSGLLFAVGLCLSGMTQPGKVVGFLDFTGSGGRWDPSLMFVMGGGVLVLVLAQQLARARRAPVFGACFPDPARPDLDARLVGGAALFGLGWGVAGYCPGPAVVAFGVGVKSALVFLPAMAAGIFLVQRLDARRGVEQRDG